MAPKLWSVSAWINVGGSHIWLYYIFKLLSLWFRIKMWYICFGYKPRYIRIRFGTRSNDYIPSFSIRNIFRFYLSFYFIFIAFNSYNFLYSKLHFLLFLELQHSYMNLTFIKIRLMTRRTKSAFLSRDSKAKCCVHWSVNKFYYR
jgi:hypothetical protein